MSDRLRFHGVTKRYRLPLEPRSLVLQLMKHSGRAPATVDAVADLDLAVGSGEIVSLLGHNGAGKSTVLRLAAGVTAPTSGSIARNGRFAAVLGLAATFHPELSGLENVLLNGVLHGLTIAGVRERLDTILEFAGIGDFIHAPVQTYSQGMTMRLGFAIAVHTDFDILVIDEVLSVGDREYRLRCLEKLLSLRDVGKAILCATHDRDQVLRLGGRFYELAAGRVIGTGLADDLPQS